MISLQQCRHALWFHPSQIMQGSVDWRVTPKSKAYVAIVPPTVIPGRVRVKHASKNRIKVQLDEAQVASIRDWTSGLPDNVLKATVCDTGVIEYMGPYTVMGADMAPANIEPPVGTDVYARVTVRVHRIGSLYKTVIRVVDVLCADIASI